MSVEWSVAKVTSLGMREAVNFLLFGVIDVSQTPKCFRCPDNLDVTLLFWLVGQLRWLGVQVVLMKLKILEKNTAEIGERLIIGDLHTIKKQRACQQTGKQNDWRFQLTNSRFPGNKPKPRNGITSSSARSAALLVGWVHWKMNICWMWPWHVPDMVRGALFGWLGFGVRMKMSWKETVTYWIAPLVFMVTPVILIESAFCAPVAVTFFEHCFSWRPCFICRWGRASKIHMWWSNVQCAFDRSSRSVCSCFFSDNPAYQWTMMPQVLWCQQASLKPFIDP